MRKIKFRGKDADGVIRYGGYCEDISGIPIIIDEYGDDFKVFSESVAQLVGYDADNAEVYEGDVLIDDDGHEYIATLDSMLLWTKDPQIEYWHVPFNQADDDGLPHSSNKLLWDFYKNCCEKLTHTDFLRLKKE